MEIALQTPSTNCILKPNHCVRVPYIAFRLFTTRMSATSAHSRPQNQDTSDGEGEIRNITFSGREGFVTNSVVGLLYLSFVAFTPANRKVFSIPELLNLNPGFSTSRKNKQLSLGSLYEESGLNTPLSGNRGRSPLFSGSPRTSLGPRSSIPFPVSKTDGDSTKNENACRRASTNDPDFNDRRRSSFTDNVTAAQVPRSSRAGSFALSRGLAIATVKTVYQRGDASVPQSARGVISVQEEGTISPGFPLNTAASIMSLAEKQQQVPRMDSQ